MGSSSVVLWWEEWQLRILVLGSLFLQCFLAFAAVHRRRSIPASLRFFIWLAYLGSDALAIYALATLFNRHKTDNQGGSHVLATLVSPQGKGGGDDTGLEVFWAPVLLLHLAGPDSITSYNIEDNELWRRHVLTVISQVKDGWKNYIEDTSTYWMFNDRRGQLTIQHELCDEELCKSLDVPFDESIIVWHIATDICFYEGAPAANHHHLKAATRCREISNYMLYLLVVNPDILMSGTRANILSNTCKELRSMFEDEKPPSDESDLTREIHRRAQSSNVDAAATEELIPRASKLASQLLAMDGDKRWKVMQGVWVEMLCFSASRCRGYLHAKSLGQGGEYLSYVWLLLWYMGLESVAERQQRSDFRSHVERVASRQLPCTETESSQEPEIQEEEGAVVPLFQEGDIGVAVRSNVEDEEAGAVTLEIQDDEEAATTAHASKATVPGDNNV
uniref:DUF4220 domain-containing protein n=1 Tax=Oryza sativa subsp. indica TaxID=39946 RepID=Q9XEM2_ORYSI|nr:unknown [Oryza sativa Indica Group]